MNRREIEQMAHRLMNKHDVDKDWKFDFNRTKRKLGICDYTKKTIYVTKYMIDSNRISDAEIKDTILHEIAHALEGKEAGHGWKWKATASRLGAKPQRCKELDQPVVPYKWIAYCDECDRIVAGWFRKPRARISRTQRHTVCSQVVEVKKKDELEEVDEE